MSSLDEMNAVWRALQERYPLYPNPLLDTTKDAHEILVGCACGARYRLLLNGDTSIPPVPAALDISCGNCGTSVHNAPTYSGHSGGVFNATTVRLQK